MAWVDGSAGAAGDMLLAALFDAGVDADVMANAASAVAPVELRFWQEVRHGFRVARAEVLAGPEEREHPPHRTWHDVRALLDAADLDETTRTTAHAVFERLAVAEGAVHGTPPDEVHFHEVGAHDSIGDVVGVCAGFAALGARLHVGPLSLGGGTAQTSHGPIPVPGPAVLRLLEGSGAVASGGPVDSELCTPTGAALLTTLADAFGPMPPMTVRSNGFSAGSREVPGTSGVLRLVVGDQVDDDALSPDDESAVVLETNVDDLDPRLWPRVLSALLAAGASDAWLTPVLMKKGRPAHTLHVLSRAEPVLLQHLARLVFTETSAIGLRTYQVGKTALQRRETTVDVGGHAVRVKQALLDGLVVNAQPEHDDVAAAAQALRVPAKVVLARATSQAAALLGRDAAEESTT
ncbi:MAG TPA: nickel pincer cofactor biosynthesis protein LarC [Actinomycetales bacterium]|nr:nickel pincer cofactor biosynthesis protein LarC [Actinomycetales bacterium]